MIYNFFTSFLFLFASFSTTTAPHIDPPKQIASATVTAESKIASVYSSLKANSFALPEFESFSKAVKGFYLLKEQGAVKKDILTLIDFSKSSNTKRLWIIDMATKTVLYNSLVSHGRNSGDEFATSFSNEGSSFKSSLGFYATGEIYQGKHGSSLRLDGLEKGINNNARSRGVVIHAADYVCDNFIKLHNRLGRSQGCPALPNNLTKEIITLIKDKSCLFIYHPSGTYQSASKLLS
ncbi:MAG: murein L,D-transpeptidase catalytic domain family protein [Chitinophagaceae bacterium]|nr:MAG: murein L,D-transpeptidase catalytic domain family protein [Chitinophagaceae bacterium]